MDIDYYDVDQWVSLGNVPMGADHGYTSHNTNYRVTSEFENAYQSTVRKGFPAIWFNFEGRTSFEFRNYNTNPLARKIETEWWYVADDGSDHDIIIVKASPDGNFAITGSNDHILELSGLRPEWEYDIVMGVVPDQIAAEDYARYLHDVGRQERSFVER
jgi:hypothetical protein